VQNKEVTEAIQKVAAAYDCKIAEGVLSHQMKQFVIDANKVILSVGNAETRVDDAEFEENEVYAIDVVTSTGEGKVSVDTNSLHLLDFHIIWNVMIFPYWNREATVQLCTWNMRNTWWCSEEPMLILWLYFKF